MTEPEFVEPVGMPDEGEQPAKTMTDRIEETQALVADMADDKPEDETNEQSEVAVNDERQF